MKDIFISYTREDRAVAGKLAARFERDGWEAFWDRKIEPGAEWNEEIQRALQGARCVIVLWSAASQKSFWVRGEAADAYERDVYLPVLIDETGPPMLFRHVQAESIARWIKAGDLESLERLISAVESRIGEPQGFGNLEPVTEKDALTPEHLHIVHSCWRVDKETTFGPMPYQIHLIIYGHPDALARVESVDYILPGYPDGHRRQPGGPRERLFELQELANGFTIAQAHVRLRSESPDHSKTLTLSRFINMSDSGPHLENDFIGRVQLPESH